MNFNDVFGPGGPFGCNMAFIFHARVVALRDMGACPNPFGSFQLLMGLRPCRCAVSAIARTPTHSRLDQYTRRCCMGFAPAPSHPSHERAKKYFREGCFSAVLRLAKGVLAMKFINSVKLATHLANVGDAKTLVIHPAGTTHQQLSDAEQELGCEERYGSC